jgi:hypothetical protein
MPRWVEVTGSLCLLSTNFGRWRSLAVVEFCKANPRREGAADEAIVGAEGSRRSMSVVLIFPFFNKKTAFIPENPFRLDSCNPGEVSRNE